MLMYRIFSVILIDLNGPIKQNKVNKTGEKVFNILSSVHSTIFLCSYIEPWTVYIES